MINLKLQEEDRMEIDKFKNRIKKVNSNRRHKIRNSLGVYDAFKYYRKNRTREPKYVLNESQYFSIIRQVNEALCDEIIRGKDITLPERMGTLELRKFGSKIEFKNGKLRTNLPVDWDRTLELWYEDPIAKENKTLVRIETRDIYTIYYNKATANYNNKVFYKFNVNKALKQRLKDQIKYNNLDALYLGKNR